MEHGYPDLTNLYRWPYTETDNPNTVIEPTTRCNLSCPACYRVSRLAHNKNRDMSLEEMKRYIDDVVRLRNTSCLSFLGGEPLLHPQLNDAIAYAKKQQLNVGVYSNGLLLDDQRLREFRDLGVSYIFVHVDKHQGRGDTEREINQIREYFCDMFRRVGGVQFGFSFQLMEEDLPDLREIVECFTRNADIVRMLNFALCTNVTRNVRPCPEDERDTGSRIEDLEASRNEAQMRMCDAIQKAYGLEWSAYLGSRYDRQVPGKISALCAFNRGELLGSVGSDVIREKYEWAYRKYGKYPYIEKIPIETTLADLRHLFFDRSIRNINLRLLKCLGRRIDVQLVAVSFSPLLREEGLNVCESCTDAVLYRGKFTPMCSLESVIEADEAQLHTERTIDPGFMQGH